MWKSKSGVLPKIVLENYTKKWKLETNYKNTKYITFSKSNQNDKHHFTINSKTLEKTKEYKYLGIVVNTKGTVYPVLNDLTCKAKRAIW